MFEASKAGASLRLGLRGVPQPTLTLDVPPAACTCPPFPSPSQGVHRRFDEEGSAVDSPQRVVLRGQPLATGKYKRWA